MPNDERNLETMPDGALGLIPLESCKELGLKVDQYLVGWREKRQHQHQNDPAFKGYRSRFLYHLNRSAAFRNRRSKGCHQRVCPRL